VFFGVFWDIYFLGAGRAEALRIFGRFNRGLKLAATPGRSLAANDTHPLSKDVALSASTLRFRKANWQVTYGLARGCDCKPF
jgi:hypothetical protein